MSKYISATMLVRKHSEGYKLAKEIARECDATEHVAYIDDLTAHGNGGLVTSSDEVADAWEEQFIIHR